MTGRTLGAGEGAAVILPDFPAVMVLPKEGDCTRGNDFKLKEGRNRLKEKVFYSKRGEALAQVAQRGGRCPIPGDAQDQADQGSEHLFEL